MCNCSTLQGLGETQRLLTSYEIADFLIRHPVVAENVAQTKLAIAAGAYDWDYNPALQWRVPGTVPPWGMQVDDSKYGSVVIQPRPERWYYSGWTGATGTINDPPYVSPGTTTEDVLADLQNAIKAAILPVAIGIGVYFAVATRRKRGK